MTAASKTTKLIMESPVVPVKRPEILLKLAEKAKKSILSREESELLLKKQKDELYILYMRLKQCDNWPNHLAVGFVSPKAQKDKPFIVIEHQESWVHTAGPFEPVMFLISTDRKWKLCLQNLDVLLEGELNSERPDEGIIDIVKCQITTDHVLCGGCYNLDKDTLENKLGYFPKSLNLLRSPDEKIHNRMCEVWFVPKANTKRISNGNYVCSSCYKDQQRIAKRLEFHDELTEKQRRKRQSHSTHTPVTYLSPKSKKARLDISQKKMKQLKKAAKRYKRRTTVELSSKQSEDMSKLYSAIDEEANQLQQIKIEADKLGEVALKGSKVKRSELLTAVWDKERSELIRNQHRNGKFVFEKNVRTKVK